MDVIDRITKGVHDLAENDFDKIIVEEAILIENLETSPTTSEENNNINNNNDNINNHHLKESSNYFIPNSPKKKKERKKWQCLDCFDSNINYYEGLRRKNVLIIIILFSYLIFYQ